MVVLGRTINALLRNTERGKVTKYYAKCLYTGKCENCLQLLVDPIPILNNIFILRSLGRYRPLRYQLKRACVCDDFCISGDWYLQSRAELISTSLTLSCFLLSPLLLYPFLRNSDLIAFNPRQCKLLS